MATELSHGYRAPDATTLLNARTRDIFPRGVYGDTGLVTPAVSGLAVTLAPYIAVGKDGLVQRDTASQDLVVIAGITQRILLRLVYVQKAPPIVTVSVMDETDWTALSSDEQLEYITFAQVSPPALATSVVDADIDYTARDAVDTLARSPWRAVVATFGDLPQPPQAVVRDGDIALSLDDFTQWVFTGANGWNILTFGDGLFDLLDYRVKMLSTAAQAPFLELGRNGLVLTDAGSAVVAVQAPVHAALTQVGAFDADAAAPAALAARAQRSSAAGVVYIKGRANVAATVQAGDLRIGNIATVAAHVSTVLIGDADVGTVIVAAVLTISVVDGAAAYAYLKVGANPAIVQINDMRLFQVKRSPGRLGLICGGPVVGGEFDLGDTLVALNTYSTTGGSEIFYCSQTAGLAVVTPGEGNLRLSNVSNPSYNGKRPFELDADRGRLKLTRPDGGAETSIENDVDVAGDAFTQLKQAGVASGKLNQARLATLIGGAAAVYNPTNAGIATPVLADSLHHHRDKARGDGAFSGLAPTSPGGLQVDIAAGVAYIDGEKWTIAGASFTVPDIGPVTLSYIYINGAGFPTAPVLAQTTVAATALATAGNVPIAAISTTGGGVIAAGGLRDLRRFVDKSDDKMVRTIGASGHHLTLQAAVDWFTSYLAAGQDPGVVEFMLIDDLTITTPVRLNGARGMRLRSAPRATGPNTTLGPAVIWGFDGNAIDFGGANDTEVFGLHFRFTGAGGVGAFPNSACFGNQGGVALGEGNAIRRCSTQSQNQTAFPATPNQLRAFVSFSSGVVNNLVIEDNVCDVTDFGIEMPNTATNNFIRILRNTIKQSGLSVAGDAWGIDGIYLGSGDDAQVIGNIIHPPSFDGSLAGDGSGFLEGINLGGVLRVICSQNQIHYTGTTGGTRCIVGNPFYGAVTDNRMESASSLTKGIDVGSLSPTIVTGNVVRLTSATAGPGIVASGNSKVLIQGNVVESASQTSIGIDTQSALGGGGDDCVIADNVVDMTATGVGTSATGIYIRGTGTQRHVVRNNVIRCLSRDGTGVHVSSDVDGCTIGGNSIFGSVAAGSSAVNGVVVEGVNVVVDGNIFANIGLSGAADGYAIKLVDGCSQVTIKSNVVPSTVWRGILVDGGDSNVSGNSLTTGEACVTITTTAVRGIISGNSLQPLTLKALVVTSGALGFVISGNDIIGNSTRVVDLAGTQLVFTGNRMTCGGAGFQIAGNDITVSGNTFVGGDAAQLFISFSGTLSNVAIVGNVFDISCFQLISTGFQHRLNISNNDINAACGAGGLIEAGGGGTDGLKICGNTINMTASGTPTVASSGAVIAVFDGTASAVVDGNTIECNGNFVGDAGRVIYVGFQQGSFSGNRVRFTHVRAATFTYSVLQIGSGAQGLAVTGNALRGDLGGAIIDGSHLSNGIDYVANTSNVTLTGNFIEFLLGIGVTVRGAASKNVLSGNTFLILNAAAGSIGIKVLTGASGIVIVGNNIGSIGDGDGINIAGTIGATIGNNVITGRTASGRGIFVTGATSKNMAITGNFVDGNFGGGDGGIRIDNSVVANAGNIAGNMATIDDNSGAGNTWQKLFTAGAVSTNFPPA